MNVLTNLIVRPIQKRIIICIRIVCGILVAHAASFAQMNEQPLTLQQCLSYAISNNRTIKSAQFDEQFSLQRTREIASTGLPQVNINGRLTDNLIVPANPFPALFVNGMLPPNAPPYPEGSFVAIKMSPQYSTTATAEATQLLFSQSYLIGLKAAKAAQELSQLNTRKAQEDLAYQLSLLFYNAQISRKQLDILLTNLASNEKLIGLAELQFKNGVIKKVEVDRLRVNQTNLETQMENIQTAFSQQINTLKFLMGMEQTATVQIDTTIDESKSNVLTLNRDANIFQRRTDFLLLDQQKKLYSLERKNVQSGYYPTLSAFATYGYQAYRTSFNFFDGKQPWYNSSAIGLTLSIPVFDGLKKRALAHQSQINIEKTANQSELLKQSISLDVNNANASLTNSQKSLAAQKINRQLAEEVYAQSQLEFKEGTASLSDLLNAETAMREAQNNYIRSLVQTLIAGLELQKASGTLIQ